MKNRGKTIEWMWFAVPLVLIIGVGAYLFYEYVKGREPSSLQEKTSPASSRDMTAMEEEQEELSEAIVASPDAAITEDLPKEKTGSLAQESRALNEYFAYLNSREYIKTIYPDTTVERRFQEILTRLSMNPPVFSGEGSQPELLLRNLNYFFKVLDLKDILLIKEVLAKEQATLETDLQMFYRWACGPADQGEFISLKPSLELQYQFAGYLMNTIGGRAYLSRRSPKIRLLFSYYCVLILYDADRQTRNASGIDVFPLAAQIREEISHYPDMAYYKEYTENLELIFQYYAEKR